MFWGKNVMFGGKNVMFRVKNVMSKNQCSPTTILYYNYYIYIYIIIEYMTKYQNY